MCGPVPKWQLFDGIDKEIARMSELSMPLERFAMISKEVHRFTFTATLAFTTVFLFFAGTSTAQQSAQQSTPPDTGDVVSTATQDPLTKVIAERLRARMTAFKKSDAVTFGTFLTEDYRSVDVLGLLHGYKPTSQEFAAFPIATFIASQVLALPIGQDGALVTFTLQLTQPNQGPVKLSVGEVWVKQAGLWKCQYSQATATF